MSSVEIPECVTAEQDIAEVHTVSVQTVRENKPSSKTPLSDNCDSTLSESTWSCGDLEELERKEEAKVAQSVKVVYLNTGNDNPQIQSVSMSDDMSRNIETCLLESSKQSDKTHDSSLSESTLSCEPLGELVEKVEAKMALSERNVSHSDDGKREIQSGSMSETSRNNETGECCLLEPSKQAPETQSPGKETPMGVSDEDKQQSSNTNLSPKSSKDTPSLSLIQTPTIPVQQEIPDVAKDCPQFKDTITKPPPLTSVDTSSSESDSSRTPSPCSIVHTSS